MDWSAIPLVVRGMGFNCSRERFQPKVYFHFLALLIPIPLVVHGNGPAVRFRFVPLASAIPLVVRGIGSRFLLPLVGRWIGPPFPLLFVGLASIV